MPVLVLFLLLGRSRRTIVGCFMLIGLLRLILLETRIRVKRDRVLHTASSAGEDPRPGRIVRTVSTDLGPFGNRIDILVVDESTVRGVSLLECDNEDAEYFNCGSGTDPRQLSLIL